MIGRKFLVALAAMGFVASCGPAEDNGVDPPVVVDDTVYVPVTSTTSSDTSDIVTISVSPQTANLIQSGTLNRTTGELQIGGATGPFNAATMQVLLSDGSLLTISDLPTEFVERATIQPGSSQSRVAIIGVPTATLGLPTSGTVTYSGVDLASVQVVYQNTAYDLTGNVTVTADFANGLVDVTLSGLDGTSSGPGGAQTVTDIATIQINGNTLTSGSFAGGTLVVVSDELPTTFSGSETVELDGQLFGPGADEVGGVLRIDDAEFALIGTFVGD